MSYRLKTSKDGTSHTQEFDTARQMVSSLEEARSDGQAVRVTIDSETPSPEMLTTSETMIIKDEGKRAAKDGEGPRTCPYIRDGSRLAAWMEGYDTGARLR